MLSSITQAERRAAWCEEYISEKQRMRLLALRILKNQDPLGPCSTSIRSALPMVSDLEIFVS